MSKLMSTRTRYLTPAALALAGGLAGAAYASSDDDSMTPKRIHSTETAAVTGTASPQLALDEALAQLRSAGYSDFREVEHEHGRYEIKGRNPQGERVEVYLDAHSGQILKQERDD